MSALAMIEQVCQLANDLPTLITSADRQLANPDVTRQLGAVRHIILIGCGDSLQAAIAARLAFEEVAACSIQILGPRVFMAELLHRLSHIVDQAPLVVGISASGRTPAVLEALALARTNGLRTLALTCRPESPVATIAEVAVGLEVSVLEPSPGIRTFQASLVSLCVLAGRLASSHGGDPKRQAIWCDEIAAIEDALRVTVKAALPITQLIAENTVRSGISMILAAGPHLAIARYGAAKRIEASGLFAMAQDMEEWWHVERFAYPTDMPVIIIAPPGRTHPDSIRTALKARGLGRHVIIVGMPDSASIHAHAHSVLPLGGLVREALSPLMTHPALALIAAHEALILGRQPFQRDTPEIRERLEVYQRRFPGTA